MTSEPYPVGTILKGYCGGHFGRDFYPNPGRVDAVGADWIVVRLHDGSLGFTDVEDWSEFREDCDRSTKEWCDD